MKRCALSWSSGKDSAWSLYLLRQNPDVEVVALITTINQEFDRVAMHAVRRELVEQQAASAGLPLWTIPLPWPCSNEQYEARMQAVCARAVNEGIQAIAFGDLFLADIRAYREKQLRGTGLQPLFPVWGLPTHNLAQEMIQAGLRAKITCVDPKVLPREFAGRDFDAAFLADLPPSVDPCGENGEFHSFVYDGPMFRTPLQLEAGQIVERDGFVFADLLPVAPCAITT
ncbi:MAG: adenine nucleotide alpha hydrolase [Acidobacteriia bacterium]|nr:adenine nucleotide alpha hydrolase [Terriglobia bacterium]